MPIVLLLRSSTWLSSSVTENVDQDVEATTSSDLNPPFSSCVIPIMLTMCSLLLAQLMLNNVSFYSLASRKLSPMARYDLWGVIEPTRLNDNGVKIKVHYKTCFSDLNVLTNLLEISLKCRFWFRRSWVGPESLHFWIAHDAGATYVVRFESSLGKTLT